jgi:Fe-S oxidoreductase
MATRGEEHSTRGRANVLRLAMSGRLGETGLGDEGVKGVMALCLECRACKAECPVGVDVARFKSEFLADYWKRHGTPLRARVLGHIHDLSRWGSRLAPLSNWVVGSAPARWLNDQLLGLDRRRKPPAWTSRTFAQQFRAMEHSDDVGSGFSRIGDKRVYIFNDTFTNYYNPGIGLAGARVLDAAGLPASLAPNGCCGRPLISQGLLDDARDYAAMNTDRLYPIAEQGGILVFFEPSCLSAVREDAPALLRGELQRKARRVSEASILFEALLHREWSPDTRLLPIQSRSTKILLHGHCHQKAMGLLPPARELLSRIPGATVVDLDAGCCGMAGSFGYVRDHYEVSRTIGERRLLPAARRLEPDAVLVASGVSCRHQVADFAGTRALHPAELLETLLPQLPQLPPRGSEPA